MWPRGQSWSPDLWWSDIFTMAAPYSLALPGQGLSLLYEGVGLESGPCGALFVVP